MVQSIKDQVVMSQLVLKHVPVGVLNAKTSTEIYEIPEVREHVVIADKVAVQLSALYKNEKFGVERIPCEHGKGAKFAYYKLPHSAKVCDVKKPENKTIISKPNIEVFAKEDKVVVDLPNFTITVHLKG